MATKKFKNWIKEQFGPDVGAKIVCDGRKLGWNLNWSVMKGTTPLRLIMILAAENKFNSEFLADPDWLAAKVRTLLDLGDNRLLARLYKDPRELDWHDFLRICDVDADGIDVSKESKEDAEGEVSRLSQQGELCRAVLLAKYLTEIGVLKITGGVDFATPRRIKDRKATIPQILAAVTINDIASGAIERFNGAITRAKAALKEASSASPMAVVRPYCSQWADTFRDYDDSLATIKKQEQHFLAFLHAMLLSAAEGRRFEPATPYGQQLTKTALLYGNFVLPFLKGTPETSIPLDAYNEYWASSYMNALVAVLGMKSEPGIPNVVMAEDTTAVTLDRIGSYTFLRGNSEKDRVLIRVLRANTPSTLQTLAGKIEKHASFSGAKRFVVDKGLTAKLGMIAQEALDMVRASHPFSAILENLDGGTIEYRDKVPEDRRDDLLLLAMRLCKDFSLGKDGVEVYRVVPDPDLYSSLYGADATLPDKTLASSPAEVVASVGGVPSHIISENLNQLPFLEIPENAGIIGLPFENYARPLSKVAFFTAPSGSASAEDIRNLLEALTAAKADERNKVVEAAEKMGLSVNVKDIGDLIGAPQQWRSEYVAKNDFLLEEIARAVDVWADLLNDIDHHLIFCKKMIKSIVSAAEKHVIKEELQADRANEGFMMRQDSKSDLEVALERVNYLDAYFEVVAAIDPALGGLLRVIFSRLMANERVMDYTVDMLLGGL